MNLNVFRTKLKDYLLPNKFEIQINPPKILNMDTKEFRFYAYSVSNILINLSEETSTILGRKFKVSGSKNTENITINFYLTENNKIIDFFTKWIEKIINYEQGIVEYFENYKSDVYIYILNKELEKNTTIKLIDCFPASFTISDLSWGSKDEILSSSVQFVVNDIKIL